MATARLTLTEAARRGLLGLPGVVRVREYRGPWLRDDLVAGLALSALLVPVGMGYAEAAGLPATAGLYATIGALVAYFVVGPSRILIVGPDSSLLPLVAASVGPLSGGDPARALGQLLLVDPPDERHPLAEAGGDLLEP